jgi:Domain of unknown function (DUF4307)
VPTPPPLPPDRPDLAQRYAVRSGSTRTAAGLAVVGLALVGMFAALVWGLADRHTGVRAGVLGYGDITPASVRITLEVSRPAGADVVCDVAAVGEDKVDVGAARVDVPAGGADPAVVDVVIETASPPVGARLLGCSPVG